MDINFHYFAVKVLTVNAGFEESDAQLISSYSQFVDDFEVLSLNKDMGYRLEIQDLNKGVVFYYAGVDTVTSSISTDKKSITWRFLDDWHNKLNVSNFGAKTTVNIYNRMGIDVKHKLGMIMTIPVVFQSNGSESQDKSSVLSKPIMIQWGCLGKDTKVLMSDKTYKIVSEIKVGDLVLNEKWRVSKLEIFILVLKK